MVIGVIAVLAVIADFVGAGQTQQTASPAPTSTTAPILPTTPPKGAVVSGAGGQIAPLLPPSPMPTETPIPTETSAPTDTPMPATETPKPYTPLDDFPAVATVVAGDNNDTPAIPKLRSFIWDPSTGILQVAFNMDQNLTDGLTRDGIKQEMSDIYTAAFHATMPVEQVNVAAWGPFQDQYGNVSYEPAYTTTLTRDVASRINWNADQAELELTIIPGLWQVNYAQPSMGF